MKRIYVLAIVFLLASSAVVTSQPFSASITIFPGCGLSYAYGQKVYGELYVSDDAWVTRWVEDQYGATWYHWGTRFYLAGSHTFYGYMGLPIGTHIMKIHAQRVSDGAIVTDQCEYTVCCGSSVWIPARPSCNCEEVQFSAAVDKTQVTPGDYVTVTVTVTNNMVSECKKRFDAGHLEIDWGILGGDTSPLEEDVLVKPGETKPVLEETHLIPPVSEGDYSIVISYSDAECTWIDYATLSVVLPTAGSFEILSYPDVINVDEKGRIRLLVRNQSQKEAQFILSVDAPAELSLSRSMYTTTIPRAGYTEINVEFRPREEGVYTIELGLTSEGKDMGSASLSVTVEKPLSGTLEIVSPPTSTHINESTSAVLQVTNSGQYDTAYQISAAGTGVTITAIPELFIPALQSRNVEIFITPVEEGVHEVVFRLEAKGELMDSEAVSFEAEMKFPLLLMGAVAAGIAIIAIAGYLLLRRH